MSFRSPLRNEWDAYKPKMEAQAKMPGYEGAIARAMLDFIPVLVDAAERERDRKTDPRDFIAVLTGVMCNIGEQAIKLNVQPGDHRSALTIMLTRLQADIGRRLAEGPKSNGGIFLPGLGG